MAECLFKNGQSFSELKQTCLELTALNIKLNPLKDGAITTGSPAYILFDKDRKKAELFLPNREKGVVLPKTNQGNWANDEFIVVSWKEYVVQQHGKAVFGGQ